MQTRLLFGIGDTNTPGIAAAIIFLLVFLVIGIIAFKMLKRTVAMAFRTAIVAVIILIAIVGASALYLFNRTGASEKTHTPSRTAPR